MPLGTAQSGCVFEAAGKGAAEVGLEDFAVGVFYQAPGVVGVAVLG